MKAGCARGSSSSDMSHNVWVLVEDEDMGN